MRTSKFIAALLMLISFGIHAASIQGKVVGVADGDTVTVLDEQNTQHKITVARH